MSFRNPNVNNDFEDLGEWSPDMSFKQQGELYYRILAHKDKLKRKK